MKSIFVVLLLTASTAFATTHVNISFTQQHSIAASKTTKLPKDKFQLKTTDNSEQFENKDDSSRFARIEADEEKSKIHFNSNQKVVANAKSNQDSSADYRSGRVQSEEREDFYSSHSQNPDRTFFNSNREILHGQFRNLSPLDKQNMEFERYIQNYHSGPTVETVYESAKPEMQHTLTTAPVNEISERIVKFERQVVLPAKAENVQPTTDVLKQIVNHQTVIPSNTASLTSSSTSSSPSLSPSTPSVSASSSPGNNYKVSLDQKPSVVGKDGFSFDVNYKKPNYNDPTIKYNDAHFSNQVPPSIEESRSDYGDYYNNILSRQQVADNYHPVAQRPTVTKTIQIAQPAIKAKKYEVRHPAIQKEFYDIEERVVIKPAGTVVVELERPSAKILKEETTLPLGHPHPAVAGAYMSSRNTPTFSNIIYTNAGSSASNHPNNQYVPHQTYLNKNVPDHNSAASSTSSTYDQSSKEVNVQSNRNKPYVGETHFSTTKPIHAPKPQSREIVVITDGHGNQRQISTDQFTYSRDETEKAPSRPVYNQRNSFGYEDNGRISTQSNVSPQRNIEDFSFDAEYINTSSNTNLRKEIKPARLQQASSERFIEQNQQSQTQPIIKHEHKIVLSPSQHNIYLGRNQEVPKMKFIEETAEVREIKPYIQNNRGHVVYVQTNQMPELKYVQRSEDKPAASVSSQVVQFHNSLQRSHSSGTDNRVQYSAPYSQMRYHSNEDLNKNEQQHYKLTSSQQKSENLVLEQKPVIEVTKSSKVSSVEKQAPQAHIEIKIPSRLANDGNKSVLVSSTIRPIMMDDDRDQTQNSKLEISVTNNGEAQQEQTFEDELDKSDQRDINSDNKNEDIAYKDSERVSDIKVKPDCETSVSENYELVPEISNYGQHKSMRIVESSSSSSSASVNSAASTAESNAVQTNIQPQDVAVNVKSAAGHISPAGSRVIASTAAPKEVSPSESYHKRRIVVNHPFQTVREVVEHEPYTNYHEVQVNEPANHALYHSDKYYQPHGALRQSENKHSPAYYN